MQRKRYWCLLVMLVAVAFAVPPERAQAQAVYRGRAYNAPVCSNPNCGMCNQIRAQLQSQQSQQQQTYTPSYPVNVTIPTATDATDYELIQVPVVTQVKRCNGVTCWYENVTTYRTERRPVARAVKAVATAAANLLRVTDLVPTPHDAVVELVALAAPKSTEVLYDLGCGDGRVLIAAASGYGCRAVGVELNPVSFREAADRVDGFGLAARIKLYQGDVLAYSYPDADVVTMYLYPELMERVMRRLRPGTRVVSYLHPIPGGKKTTVGSHTFYTWTVQ